MNTHNKILLIEDNQDLVAMYRTKFEREGFKIEHALDGGQGLTLAIEYKPDVILLDILMPTMDGWQVLSAIKNNTSLQAKIIILSNLGQQELIDKSFQGGASAYLIKANYTPSEVVNKVREFLQENTPVSYHLKFTPDAFDYDRFLATTPDAVKASTCPTCYGDVLVELLPDTQVQDGSWWKAHFICSKCSEKF